MSGKLVFAHKDKKPGEAERATWKLLVVDDDPEIHAVTKLSLRSLKHRGRGLEILSAYSGAEAAAILAQRSDIAAILLDVVMETEDAGLNLVRHIRDDLKNRFVRIILRTGQPGQAPEERVIVDYDINDYKAKTELTAQKLFTATLTALRAYDDIMALDAHRRGLRQIIEASDTLMKIRSLQHFAEAVLMQLSTMLGVGANGILCVQRAPNDADRNIYVLAASPEYHAEHQTTLAKLALDEQMAGAIKETFERQDGIHGADFHTFYMGDGQQDQEIVAYLHCQEPLESLSTDLVRLFCVKISIGFSNLDLYDKLAAANTDLERKVLERTRELEAANRALELLATTDPLTGAFNRRRFLEEAGRDVERSRRGEVPLTVAMLDIDHFKRINDSFGHAAGDAVLVELVKRANLALRGMDVLGRFGGEEFAILLPDAAPDGAFSVAERLRQTIAAQPFETDNGSVEMTVSIGLATLNGDQTLDALLRSADEALYEAKGGGRNRVVSAH